MNCESKVVEIIDAAEEVTDPLGGLVEKTADEAGAPFMPEALEQLREFHACRRAGVELPTSSDLNADAQLFSQLSVGCRGVILPRAHMAGS